MARSYSLKNVILTIGGNTISGYGDADAIGFEWNSALWEKFVSADGDAVYARIDDRSLAVTITVHQRSRAYPILAGLLETQTGDTLGITPPALLPLPFNMTDPSNGDVLLSPDTVFMSRPAPSKARGLGTVSFLVDLPKPTWVYGPLNLVL